MILYIDKTEVPDLENLSPSVLRYCIRKAEQARGRYKHLMDYYLGQHDIFLGKPGANEVRVSANYAKYVVDVTLGYYLGEAVKYDANRQQEGKAAHDDEMETVTPDLSGSDVIDLSPLLDCYDSQRISQLDLELGRTMGIMGDCMEVCYASSDADPQPRSARISPDNGILVCDSTVEHNKLFGIVWEQRENTNGQKYYCRSTTMPDMTDEQLRKVSRAARDPATGKGITVPGDMKYRDWYKKFVEGHPQALAREKAVKNKAADREQFRRYRAVLGENVPKTLDDFQKLKYTDGEKWEFVKLDYSRRQRLIKHPELALPNADHAIAPVPKFTQYLFNPESAKGWPKGQAITSRLGYDKDSWSAMRREIVQGASCYPASSKGNNGHGDLYEQKMVLYGTKELPANVIVGWIVKPDGETVMTTAYIKEV